MSELPLCRMQGMRTSHEPWRSCWVAILTCTTLSSQVGCSSWRKRFARPPALAAQAASANLPSVEPPPPPEMPTSTDVAAVVAQSPPIAEPDPEPMGPTDRFGQQPVLRPFVKKQEPRGVRLAKCTGRFAGTVVTAVGYTVGFVAMLAFMAWAKTDNDHNDFDDF